MSQITKFPPSPSAAVIDAFQTARRHSLTYTAPTLESGSLNLRLFRVAVRLQQAAASSRRHPHVGHR